MDLPSKGFDEETRYHYVTVVIWNWVHKRHIPYRDVEDLVQEGAIAFEKKWAETHNKSLCSVVAISAAIEAMRREPTLKRDKKSGSYRTIPIVPLEHRYKQITRQGFRSRTFYRKEEAPADKVVDPTEYFDFDPLLHKQLVQAIEGLEERRKKVLVDWLNNKKGVITAKEMNISEGRVTQLRNSAIEILRREVT